MISIDHNLGEYVWRITYDEYEDFETALNHSLGKDYMLVQLHGPWANFDSNRFTITNNGSTSVNIDASSINFTVPNSNKMGDGFPVFDASVSIYYDFPTAPPTPTPSTAPTNQPVTHYIRPYIGNKKVSTMYVGNKAIKEAYVGNKRVYGQYTTAAVQNFGVNIFMTYDFNKQATFGGNGIKIVISRKNGSSYTDVYTFQTYKLDKNGYNEFNYFADPSNLYISVYVNKTFTRTEDGDYYPRTFSFSVSGTSISTSTDISTSTSNNTSTHTITEIKREYVALSGTNVTCELHINRVL